MNHVDVSSLCKVPSQSASVQHSHVNARGKVTLSKGRHQKGEGRLKWWSPVLDQGGLSPSSTASFPTLEKSAGARFRSCIHKISCTLWCCCSELVVWSFMIRFHYLTRVLALGRLKSITWLGVLSQESQIGSSSGLISLLLVSLETLKSHGQRQDLNKDSLEFWMSRGWLGRIMDDGRGWGSKPGAARSLSGSSVLLLLHREIVASRAPMWLNVLQEHIQL